jgi:phosphoglycolate phosphatase-like HAD superfamily hydrolase
LLSPDKLSREVLNIPKSTDILDHIYSLPSPQQEEAMNAIRDIERRAMQVQKPQPGLLQLMDYLAEKGIRKGICTRNFE